MKPPVIARVGVDVSRHILRILAPLYSRENLCTNTEQAPSSLIWRSLTYTSAMPRCPKFRKTSPLTIQNPQHIFQFCLKITINDLSQLNFESETIVIFVIVMHICAQLEDLLHILRALFWQNNTR